MGKNTGTEFEREINQVCLAYQAAGIAKIEKVDPPTLVLRPPGRPPIVKHLPNPFLDFVGVWTEYRLPIMFEVKTTKTDILPINTMGSGITATQIANAVKWERAGFIVFFLWRYGTEVRLATVAGIVKELTARKSLRWCMAYPVPQGKGFIFTDFLAVMRGIHKPTPPPNQ